MFIEVPHMEIAPIVIWPLSEPFEPFQSEFGHLCAAVRQGVLSLAADRWMVYTANRKLILIKEHCNANNQQCHSSLTSGEWGRQCEYAALLPKEARTESLR